MAREQTTVVAALAQRLATDPDGPYLDFEGDAHSAREIDAAASRLAAVLRDRGVARGDRVATLLDNRAEQVISFFAALKLAAVQVPINTAYKGEFLRHQLADSGAGVLVVQGDYASRVVEITGGAPALAHCIVVGKPDAVIDEVTVSDWATELDRSDLPAVDDVDVRPSDLACFIYTAGTTGPRRAACSRTTTS
jgi:carnitine-CoA ligase